MINKREIEHITLEDIAHTSIVHNMQGKTIHVGDSILLSTGQTYTVKSIANDYEGLVRVYYGDNADEFVLLHMIIDTRSPKTDDIK